MIRGTWIRLPWKRLLNCTLKLKVVIVANLYGTPNKMDELRAVADKYGAVIIGKILQSLSELHIKTSKPAFSVI